ncbi:acyl-CoA synthetase [Sorangium cellulosum]|uniref:Acyl-CoA synthetase n=1 Tax=Sorangium cellulosum TaxID=56 RepID=A0A2L0F7A9_SORCE|nr:AMP-binding protein [Sorangium cellulosum]AUX47458.1 acyl-CoA synthetase [Sorangium cellulosum]
MASPLVARLAQLRSSARIAVEDERGQTTFAELMDRALRVRGALLAASAPRGAGERAEPASLEGERLLLLASPGAAWVAALLGTILAGGIALPLSPLYPPAELTWLAGDAGVRRVIVSDDLAALAAPLAQGRAVLRVEDLERAAPGPESALADLAEDDPALLLYTSGTTGKPKGALLTHRNLAVQAELLRAAWGFSEEDVLLHALPLHHMHGVCIALATSLLAGSATRMLPRFDAQRVAAEIARRSATVLMAVPTMYQRLFEHVDRGGAPGFAAGARALRLATSGSAALPVTLAERWRDLTGAIPLERFGMTEIGVGMSNPLDPGARRAGWVGAPLPTVEARITDDAGAAAGWAPGEERGQPGGAAVARGELWIRGPSVFKGYLGREDETRAAFQDGWFRTGDVAERSADGYFRLLGRTSVDILKSGGYKLSSLEIEETLRDHGAIAEVAVVGVPDEEWGERVVAVVVAAPGREAECATAPLRAWAKERLAPYKVPRDAIVVQALPRNAMGKVVKPELVKAIERGTLAGRSS